jgi:hypothetical protein
MEAVHFRYDLNGAQHPWRDSYMKLSRLSHNEMKGKMHE